MYAHGSDRAICCSVGFVLRCMHSYPVRCLSLLPVALTYSILYKIRINDARADISANPIFIMAFRHEQAKGVTTVTPFALRTMPFSSDAGTCCMTGVVSLSQMMRFYLHLQWSIRFH